MSNSIAADTYGDRSVRITDWPQITHLNAAAGSLTIHGWTLHVADGLPLSFPKWTRGQLGSRGHGADLSQERSSRDTSEA